MKMSSTLSSEQQDNLRLYYNYLYPFENVFNWLNAGYINESMRREFAFMSHNKKMHRHVRFGSHFEWKLFVQRHLPVRMEVGPQYNTMFHRGDEYKNLMNNTSMLQDNDVAHIQPSEWNNKLLAIQRARQIAPHAQQNNSGTSYSNELHSFKKVAIDPNIKHFVTRRELVFDIDLNDYDDVRSCCKGPQVCKECWDIANAAIVAINAYIKGYFRMKHVLWVFSGRRGVHGWVSDSNATRNNISARQSIVNQLCIVHVHKLNNVLEFYRTYYFIRFDRMAWPVEALRLLLPLFRNHWLRTTNASSLPDFAKFLDPRIRHLFHTQHHQCCVERFDEFAQQLREVNANPSNRALPGYYSVHTVMYRIVFACLYPRFDAPGQFAFGLIILSYLLRCFNCFLRNFADVDSWLAFDFVCIVVTKQMNHLLKLPFCVHPETQRICIPFEPIDRTKVFDVLDAPTLSQLVTCIQQQRLLPLSFRKAYLLMRVKSHILQSQMKHAQRDNNNNTLNDQGEQTKVRTAEQIELKTENTTPPF